MEITDSIITRLEESVVKSDGCWIWIGHKDKDGYGRMRIGHRKIAGAHRVSWAIANKADPKGMLVCHHCDTPSCVNPDHLYLGTAKENNRDKIARGRANWAQGERIGTAKLTKGQVSEIFILYKSGGYRQKDIADKYGVSQGAIQLILSGKNWSTDNEPVVNMRNAPKVSLRKLTDEQKGEIIRIRADTGMNHVKLAEMYGVSQQLISLVLKRGG